MSVLHRFWWWLCGIFGVKARPLRTVEAADLPDKIQPHEVYLVGENGFLWYVAMLCPCGCGETMQLSCLPDARPRWTVTRHADSTVSLHPSVARTKGCRSHFFLKEGQIVWCREIEI